MDKRTKKLTIIVSAIFGGIIAFNFTKKIIVNYLFTHYVPPATTVSSAVAKSIKYSPFINSIGSFVAINGVELGSQIPGVITKIHFKSGQFITKNSNIIEIDDSVERADLKLTQSNLSLQEAEYKRQLELQKHNATSLSNLDRAKAKLLESQARVEKILAIIKQKHITAPFSGFLGIRKVDLGEYIRPGETSIVSLQSFDPIYLEFSIPEHLLNKVEIFQKIYFTTEQYPNTTFTGKITAINSMSDKNTHNVEIQATVANCPVSTLEIPHSKIVKCSTKDNKRNKISNYTFIPGAFASIKIKQKSTKRSIVIPSTAISYSVNGKSVFIIEKLPQLKANEERFIVKKTYVKTGGQQDNYTIIKKGLNEGQVVVSSGEFKLQDGNEVTINNKTLLPNLNLSKIGH